MQSPPLNSAARSLAYEATRFSHNDVIGNSQYVSELLDPKNRTWWDRIFTEARARRLRRRFGAGGLG